jgi:hypothetical protein
LTHPGKNKIPTIDKFLQSLDLDKSERDKRIDEENKARAAAAKGDAVPHENAKLQKGKAKSVTDPTTGHQVEVRFPDFLLLWVTPPGDTSN